MSRIFLKFETSPRPSIRVLLLGVISICSGFKVTKYSQVPEHQVSFSTKHVIVLMITVVKTHQELRTGERLYMLCKSDTDWERCTFRHRLVKLHHHCPGWVMKTAKSNIFIYDQQPFMAMINKLSA